MTTQALTLEEKKAAARARAKTAREAEQAGEANVTITDAAAAYIRETAAEQRAQEGVRLRILAGGCSGLEYRLDLLPARDGPEPGERDVTSNRGRRLLDLQSSIPRAGAGNDYERTLLRRGFQST